MSDKLVRILPLIFLTMVIVFSTPLPIYAKEYQSTSNLLNECTSEQGSTNCASNNAETIGEENIVSPQVTQSSQAETGSDGIPGLPGPPGEPGMPGQRGPPGEPGQLPP
jgi:hypothetical protein